MIVLFLLLPSALATAVCPDTATCIARIREVVTEPKRFWFGEHRRAQCSQRHVNPIDCFGPSHLSNFHSIGSRLFRVRTYHAAYLRNLVLFPRITYRAAPGHYRACEHDFHSVNRSSPIEADSLMKAVPPFDIRNRPEIDWAGLQYNDEFTILMTDVGAGTLNYLAVDFPHKTKVLKDYEPSDNFRSLPNPLVLLVFKKGPLPLNISSQDDFNLVDFMTRHSLEDNLVGMNLVVVGSDPFAIERQRLRGSVDNCHSLLMHRLREENPSPFLAQMPMEDLSQWLSVAYKVPRLEANVCCQRIEQSPGRVFVDPLGHSNVSAFFALSPPSFNSLRIATTASTYLNYHRQTRTYLALMDDLFTLVVIDGKTGKLHWLLVDIAASELASEGGKGITKASYLPLSPADPSACRNYVFALMEQTGTLAHMKQFCEGECIERKEFRMESFRQQHSLRLSALSWTRSCYDLPFAYHVLSSEKNITGEPTRASKRLHRQSDSSAQVCAAFRGSSYHHCAISSSQEKNNSLLLIVALLVSLFASSR